MQKSFTLIELLVVIAIIGLLASVVLVSMGGVKTQANMTKKLEFSRSVQHSLGAYALGIWSFDEGSGDIAYDASGYGNNGTISGAVYTDETPQKIAGRGTGKYALSFDGANDYVSAGNSASLMPSNAITIETWVYPKTTDPRNAIRRGDPRGEGYSFGIAYGQIEYVLMLQASTGARVSSLDINTWTHIVLTWDDNTDTIIVYKNGIVVSAITNKPGPLVYSSSPLIIGGINYYSPQNYWPGFIDEVRIYEKALSLVEIQQHYAEGLKSHPPLTIK